jgi:hypothetical protein
LNSQDDKRFHIIVVTLIINVFWLDSNSSIENSLDLTIQCGKMMFKELGFGGLVLQLQIYKGLYYMAFINGISQITRGECNDIT